MRFASTESAPRPSVNDTRDPAISCSISGALAVQVWTGANHVRAVAIDRIVTDCATAESAFKQDNHETIGLKRGS
jgi:hypothetical protein